MAVVLGGCSALQWPLSSPIADTTAERWCEVAEEGSAIYGEFADDLDARVSVPAMEVREIAPPASSFGDRGPSVRSWQGYLVELGFAPGMIDGIHGPQTERATSAWLRSRSVARTLSSESIATPWAADYVRAKGIVEDHRPGLLALCQGLEGYDVTKEELLDEGFVPAARAFGDVVAIHRDVTAPAPGQRATGGYDHQAILDKLRIVEAEATTALHQR